MMFQSIKVKITIIVLSILLCVMSIQLLANFIFAEKYYINRKSRMIKNAYQELSQTNPGEEGVNLLEIINQYEEVNNLKFILIDGNHNVLFDSKRVKNKLEYKKTLSYFEDREKSYKIDADIHIVKQKNGNDLLSLYGIIMAEDTQYYITIYTSVKAIRLDMQDINLFIFYIVIVALVAGGFITYFTVGRITRPIEEIDETAQRVSLLDFSKRATEGLSRDELGRLALNINYMSDNLERTIQELKEANKQLELDNQYKEKINQERKTFVANVSHELKTPLAVLSGYAEMLKSDISGIDKNYYYDVILQETNYMTNLVKQLLELSALEQGILSLKPEPIEINQFIKELINRSEVLFKHCPRIIQLKYTSPCVILGHPFYLEQVIMNYITNAISHSEENTIIQISIKEEAEMVEISVSNQGEIISQEDSEHIWESFYQTDKARTRSEEKRIGLGLYIVKQIITVLNGEYGFENQVDGVRFWIKLKKEVL